MLALDSKMEIGRGEDRVVYAHPDDSSKCIKMARKSFGKDYVISGLHDRIYYLSRGCDTRYFDYNYIDVLYAEQLKGRGGDELFAHIPRCYGEVETNIGTGVLWQRIQNYDGSDCITLKTLFRSEGMLGENEKEIVRETLNTFFEWQLNNCIMLREMAYTNTLICEVRPGTYKLYHIDAIGCVDLVPLAEHWRFFCGLRVQSKIRSFKKRISRRFKDMYGEEF
jgi:hypothetical protein